MAKLKSGDVRLALQSPLSKGLLMHLSSIQVHTPVVTFRGKEGYLWGHTPSTCRHFQHKEISTTFSSLLFVLAAVTAETAPEGQGGRSAAEVCRATAKTQTPAVSLNSSG